MEALSLDGQGLPSGERKSYIGLKNVIEIVISLRLGYIIYTNASFHLNMH